MEAEDDEFGALYHDVLKPFSLLPSPNIKKLEACSTNSADIRCSINDGGEQVVGTVRLEIYLGSRRVFENKFVFPVGGSDADSGFNRSGNLVTDDGGKEMTSVPVNANHSQCQPSDKIAACEDPEHISDSSQCNLSERGRTVEVGDSNSDPEPGRISDGKTPECGINQKESRVDVTSSVEMQDIFTATEPCKGEPSEEGQLSEYAELDSDREKVIRATARNSADERIDFNKVQCSPLKNARHVTSTPIGRAVIPHQMTTSRPYRHQPKTKFPDMSASLFDLDLNSLEPKPWRRPSEDISDYFNFGLDEASWNSYCLKIKAMRRYMRKPIQAERGVGDGLFSAKAIPQDSTSTIQDKPSASHLIKGYRRPGFEQMEEGPSGISQEGKLNNYQTIFAGMKREHGNGSGCYNHSKRAKKIEEGSMSNMSDSEWMCRHVGMESWFRPTSLPEQERKGDQETSRKGSKRGRSKLERWTGHDRDNDDDNTSTSSLS